MNNNDKIILQFFSLLRAGLYKKPAISGLFVSCTLADWESLYILAEQQTVLGVTWDGILTLPTELHPQKPLFYKWLQGALMLEKLNTKMNAVLQETFQIAKDLEIPIALLKGQGTAALYPNPLHRQCGDIDIFSGECFVRLEKELVNYGFQEDTSHWSPKHGGLLFHDIVIENHHEVEQFFYPPHQRALERMVAEWFPKAMQQRKVSDFEVNLPPSWFEGLFGIAHFGIHLLCVGIGVRHLCDWAMIMHTQLPTMDRERFIAGVRALGLENLAAAMAELSVNYLDIPAEELAFLRKDTPQAHRRAERLLSDMLKVGNFGQYDSQIPSRNRFFAFFTLLWKKGKRNYYFWPFYRVEALLMPFARAITHFRR